MKPPNLTSAMAAAQSSGNALPSGSPELEEALPVLRKRVLLADDSPSIRESLGKLLRKAGYDVVTATHGGQVLEIVFRQPIDLVLLDLEMPEIDGWESMERINAFKPELPVIVITGQSHQRDWAQAEGARALMEKPLDLPLLLQAIGEMMSDPSQPNSRRLDPAHSPFRGSQTRRSDFRFSDAYHRWRRD